MTELDSRGSKATHNFSSSSTLHRPSTIQVLNLKNHLVGPGFPHIVTFHNQQGLRGPVIYHTTTGIEHELVTHIQPLCFYPIRPQMSLVNKSS